ncbi:MAG: hypothetical protein CVU39_18855 [Chloroflexi bacterium HGW-Chloroflexi-10]|nr:MAG: hypothetical protein CVU39_18855 [Chloroflexi bacterium HGW-Chloroflexi-10]
MNASPKIKNQNRKKDKMAVPQLPQNKPLSDQVCELIEMQIISGQLNVGDKLPTENELSDMYKVSRTVIREATKILKEKGRLESYVGKGTFVVDKTERGIGTSFNAILQMNPDSSFEYLLEVREFFEPEMAALAALKASKEQIDELQQTIDLMDRSLVGIDPIDEFLNADHKFHNLLAEATGNPIIVMIIKSLGEFMRNQQRFMTFNVVGGPQKSQKNHKSILEAIKMHNPDAAKNTMQEHIQQVYHDLNKQ